MFGVVTIPDFELQAALRLHPEWSDTPVALLDEALSSTTNSRKCQIIQANAAARQRGVVVGMTAPQGQARCAKLQFLTRSSAQETVAQDILVQWNATITPNLEVTSPGVCTVDLRGTSYRRGREEQWAQATRQALAPLHLDSRVGIANTPDLALLASQVADPICRVPQKRAAIEAFLRPFTIDRLGASLEIQSILNRWGIKTVEALLQLPKQEVIRRLGKECLPIWERAQGRTTRPLHHFRPSPVLTETSDLEPPIERLQALIFLLNRFLDQLTTRLANLYRVAASMQLDLRFDDGSTHQQRFRIPDPTRDAERLFRMLYTYLENFRSPSPITGLSLSITPTRATHVQLSLFDTNLRDPNRFTETLSQLEALLGPNRVGTPVPTPSHRPDSFQLVPFDLNPTTDPTENRQSDPPEGLPLRRFRPPKPLRIQLLKGAQAEQRIRIAFAQIQSHATHWNGPWKNSGHWWDQSQWDREEWDIELACGGLYRIAQESGQWLVDGVYD